MVEKLKESLGKFTVACSFKNIMDGYQWTFLTAYGPIWLAKEVCLAGLSNLWDLPWCIDGDFNITHFLSDRLGGYNFNSSMVDFFNVISKQDLLHIPLASGLFTWSSNRDHQFWSRLDSCLISPDLEA